MYPVIVLLTMLVLPVGSILVEHLWVASDTPLILLVGKWFVFWSVGIRLLLAGLRQFFQPGFTAAEIFHMKSDEALVVIRELGVANAAAGVVGTLSLFAPSFVTPSALAAAIFYGVAGFRHIPEPNKSRNEVIAMVSDLFIFLVLTIFLIMSGLNPAQPGTSS